MVSPRGRSLALSQMRARPEALGRRDFGGRCCPSPCGTPPRATHVCFPWMEKAVGLLRGRGLRAGGSTRAAGVCGREDLRPTSSPVTSNDEPLAWGRWRGLPRGSEGQPGGGTEAEVAAGLHSSRWGPRPAPPAVPCKPLGDFTSALMRGGQAPFPGDPLRLEARKWGREQNLPQGGPGAGGPLSLSEEAEWLQPTPWRVGQEASRQRVEVGGAWASGKSGSAPRWSSSGSRRASAHSADGRPCAGACVVAARGEPGSLRTHRARGAGGGPLSAPLPAAPESDEEGGGRPGTRRSGNTETSGCPTEGTRDTRPPTRQRPRAQPRRGRGAAARALVTGERARRPGRRVAKGTPAWRTERGGPEETGRHCFETMNNAHVDRGVGGLWPQRLLR